jgi:hypothetical protein
MLLCLSGYHYGLQIAAVGFMAFAIKFFDDSLASDDEFKRKNLDLGQMYVHGIVCGLTSWISFFYLKRADGFVAIVQFTVAVFVINAIGEYLSHKKSIENAKNENVKENLIPSSLVFLVLMPALMLIIMAFGPYVFILVSVVFAIIMFIRAKQHGIEFAW